jgi:hypothetical protein
MTFYSYFQITCVFPSAVSGCMGQRLCLFVSLFHYQHLAPLPGPLQVGNKWVATNGLNCSDLQVTLGKTRTAFNYTELNYTELLGSNWLKQ